MEDDKKHLSAEHDLPTSTLAPLPVPASSLLTRLRLPAALVLAAFAITRTVPSLNPFEAQLVVSQSAKCPAQVAPLNLGLDWRPAEDKEFTALAVRRLQGAIQIPTQSFDDMGQPGEDARFGQMEKLNKYLEETFPLTHTAVQLEKVALYGLLYTWKGSDESLKPIVLMAHQDVVPVNPSTEDRWTYPPFSGHQDEAGWIWGRGGADCKNTLVGILAAVEKLVSDDFKPTRTIILSFGFDEEISGPRSAAPLSALLLSRYGPSGVSLVLDEGFTGVDTSYGALFARLGMAEKGAISLRLSVATPGGHSSVPGKHTGIGMLSLLLVELEKHRDVPKLREGNPMLSFLDCARKYGEVGKKMGRKIQDPRKWNALGRELAEKDDVVAAFLGTTQAIDLIQGGVKINALPEFTSASINYRIDFLESTHSTFSRISSLLAPVAKSLNMTFAPNGTVPEIDNHIIRLDIIAGSALEPAPLTPGEGAAFELMSGTIKHVFEGAVVAPSAMIANTDTKWYWDLTSNIYRFVPASTELIKNFHTVDERIHIDAHLSTIQFFHKLISNTEGWTD